MENNILYRAGGGYPVENPVIRTIGEIEMTKCSEISVDGMRYRDYPIVNHSESRYIQILDNKRVETGEVVLAIDPSRRGTVMAIALVDGKLKVLDAIKCHHAKGVAVIEKHGISISYCSNRAYLRDFALFEALKATDWYENIVNQVKAV